jgi:hypothetical protein
MIIGAGISIILFLLFGLLPAFHFGSRVALFLLHNAAGTSAQTAPHARGIVILAAVLTIISGAFLSMAIGALIGAMMF